MPARNNPEVLVKNLRTLMRLRDWSTYDLGRHSDVSQRAVNKIVNGEAAPTITTLAKLAGAFGLESWELLRPDLDIEITQPLRTLIRNYQHATLKGREFIEHIAEKEANYSPEK